MRPQVTLKAVLLLPFPDGVTTLILPVTAPSGTVTLIFVAVLLSMVAATPPMVTLIAPLRLVPLMVTTVPGGPEAGVKLVIVGAAPTTKHSSVLVSWLEL